MKFEKGKPVELSAEKKVELGVKRALAEDMTTEVKWPTDLVISEINVSPIGTPVKPKDRVTARGVMTVNRRETKTGEILMPRKNVIYNVEVEDIRDEWGIPDVVVKKFKTK